MSVGHTPGPWVWVNDDEIEQLEHPFASVAEVVPIRKDEDRAQRNANARLIAAAPELYEALEELEAALLDGLCNSGVPGFDPDRLERARFAARGALAKARGEA